MANGSPGRPTKYKPEYDDKIVEFARTHQNDCDCVTTVHMANYFQVNEDTLREWARVHPSFSAAYTRAKSISLERYLNYGLTKMYTPKEFNFDSKMFALILRNKFGYTDKTYLNFPEIMSLEKKSDQIHKTLCYLLKGLISLEDCERLMNTFKTAITVENESELRPMVEYLQDEMKARRK